MIDSAKDWIKKQWVRIAAFAAILTIVAGIVDNIAKLGITAIVIRSLSTIGDFVTSYPTHLVIALIVVAIGAIYYRTKNLERFIPLSFKDDFNKDLSKWDYHGGWVITPNNELIVTDSGYGGISKVGQLWTDYKFEFEAVVVNYCVGWIIHAQDSLNFYMIQIAADKIRPHLLVNGLYILLEEKQLKQPISSNQMLKIRTEIKGSSLRIFVNEQEIYDNYKFFSVRYFKRNENGIFEPVENLEPGVVMLLPFTSGRVGFRCDGVECARISKCKVTPL